MGPDGPSNPAPTKRKRLQGACDNCRRKKARCDSSVMPDKRCSNCLALGAECTHLYANQKHAQILNRTPLKTAVEGASSGTLGEYRDKMNGLLQAVLSSTYQAPSHPAILRDTLVSLARYSRALEEVLSEETWVSTPVPAKYELAPPISGAAPRSISLEAEDDSGSEPDDDTDTVPDYLKSALFPKPNQTRYFGPSSLSYLLTMALDFNKEFHLNPHATERIIEKYKRSHFWITHPWEMPPVQPRQPFIFPDPDLMDQLVDLYFTRIHVFIPFLHRPTFEQSLKARHHLSDPDFGSCLLAVCAMGARYSNDRRVFDATATSELGCGHQWFRQVECSFSLSKPPSLCTIQAYYLAFLYAFSTSAMDKSWYLIGVAVRGALDIGLHRSQKGDLKPTVQTELRNRLWWALMIGERLISVTTGRPCSVQALDCNVELPIECDDEYWESPDPLRAFKQPPGRPTIVTHFNKIIELFSIVGAVQRALHSPRPLRDNGEDRDDQRPASLNSMEAALSSWEKSIPSLLRLGRHQQEPLFIQQSVSLWMTYYFVQMLVHRPWISRKNFRPASMEVCTNAARACSRVMDEQPAEGFFIIPAFQMFALSMSGLVLLLDIWRRELTGVSLDQSEELRDVHRCISIMKVYEPRHAALGRRVDLLIALLVSSNLPLPPGSENHSEPSLLLTDPRFAVTSSSSAHLSGSGSSTSLYPNHEDVSSSKESWLDLLTDPSSLRAPGASSSSHHSKRSAPHRQPNSSSSTSSRNYEDRRHERWQPYHVSPSVRVPSSLRHVHVYHDDPHIAMEVDNGSNGVAPLPPPVHPRATLVPVASTPPQPPPPSARRKSITPPGPSVVLSPVYSTNGSAASSSASAPTAPPPRVPDGHWRNPYVFDVNPPS